MKIRLTILFTSFFLGTAPVYAGAGCGERIEKIVCEVAPTKKLGDRFTPNRPCLDKPIEKYKRIIKEAYRKFPPFLQERFCSLDKLYIEDEFFGSAWSNPVDEKNPTKFLIGLRKAELDQNLSFLNGLAQFDSQTFGTSKNTVSYSAQMTNQLTATEFTILHELGHTFDYEHLYNRPKSDAEFLGSWTAIAWNDIQEVRPESDFSLRRSICLNNCKNQYLPIDQAKKMYSEIYAHGFLSQLSATSAMEDFADSFAFYVLDELLHVQVVVWVDGAKFDLHTIERSPSFAKKREFLKRGLKI